jgi:hypothetical protein
MPALFFEMINLATNTANQTAYFTLDEARQYFSETFTHYLVIITRAENQPGGQQVAQVPTILEDNARYTSLRITTVGLYSAGQYTYEVYGQNSNSNTDPENASVVGLLERGMMTLTDDSTIFTALTGDIPDDYRS